MVQLNALEDHASENKTIALYYETDADVQRLYMIVFQMIVFLMMPFRIMSFHMMLQLSSSSSSLLLLLSLA